MPEDEENEEEVAVGGRGDDVKREEARSRDDVRERERRRREEGAGERKRGVDGAVGRQSVEVTGLWSRRDVASVGGEEHRWRRTAVSRPRGK